MGYGQPTMGKDKRRPMGAAILGQRRQFQPGQGPVGQAIVQQPPQQQQDGLSFTQGGGAPSPSAPDLRGLPQGPFQQLTVEPKQNQGILPTAPQQGPVQPKQTPSTWNTDSYAAPQHTAEKFGNTMAGWDATKWNNADHQTPKYAVGRILSNYKPDQAGFDSAVEEIKKAYPGSSTDGKDKITIPGVGTIDVRTGASIGGTGWAWQPMEEGGGGGPQGQNAPLLSAIQQTVGMPDMQTLMDMLLRNVQSNGAVRF
jgi:hypothetical protein